MGSRGGGGGRGTEGSARGRGTDEPPRAPKGFRQENLPTDTFTPRTYQVELLDVALQRNTIVCLGAASGKTFLAVMLIKELAYQVRPTLGSDADAPNSGAPCSSDPDGSRRTVFLTLAAPVVAQQAQVIRLYTDLAVGEYTEAVIPLSADRWRQEFRQHHVLVMTAPVFLNALQRGFVAINQINLLIFDECHYAVKEHPYAHILRCMDDCPPGDIPRILGLTASMLNNKCKSPVELRRSITDLERALRSKAETASDVLMVDQYSSKPEELKRECGEYCDTTGLLEELGAILDTAIAFIDDCNFNVGPEDKDKDPRLVPRSALQECRLMLLLLGPWCCNRVAQTMVKQLSKIEEIEFFEMNRMFINYALTQLRLLLTIFASKFDTVESLEDFLEYMSPKVREMLEILHEHKPDDNFEIIGGEDYMYGAEASDSDLSDSEEDEQNYYNNNSKSGKPQKPQVHYVAVKRTGEANGVPANEVKEEESLCGIIFVERRHTAFSLNKLLQELCNWDTDLYFIQSHHLTGHGVGKGGTKGGGKGDSSEGAYKKQEDILRKFRTKELNLLVATSVLEEGVDVPKCNMVIRFDLPNDYRSYVQSKGRARAAESKFYMLVEHNQKATFQNDLQIFKGIERILAGGRQEGEEEEGTAEEEEEEVTDQEADTLLPAYMPNKEEGSARVSMSTAIALVNRYCAKLPSDAFTHLTPKCTITEERGQGEGRTFTASLQLPINSIIKQPLQGVPMPSRKLAKMAVALKTCEILHKEEELDSHLLPVGREVIRYEEEEEEGEWDEEETGGQVRPGTTKRKQYYQKKIAEPLRTVSATTGKACFLYLIDLRLTCPITEEQNTRGRKIHAPEDSPRGYGLLNARQIPKIPLFPVYTRSGEVTVSIDLQSSSVVLTDDQLSKLSAFHHFVFGGVLRLQKEPMEYQSEQAPCGCLIVPLNKDVNGETIIDWEFVDMIEKARPGHFRKDLFNPEKPKFVFKEETFQDAVVMPSYRNIDQPQYFYVAEIRHDLNPGSSFPSPELYDTFEHYYTTKYNLSITDPKQPLLDVDHTSARLNLLTPRYMNQKGVALPTSSAETRRARRENLQQKQILIPELCEVHPFPASFWRKTVCLPAILYRLNYLLVSEEIRVMIALEAKIGAVKIPHDFQFSPLDFGFKNLIEKLTSRENGHTDAGAENSVKNKTRTVKETCVQFESKSESKSESAVNVDVDVVNVAREDDVNTSNTSTSVVDTSNTSIVDGSKCSESKDEKSSLLPQETAATEVDIEASQIPTSHGLDTPEAPPIEGSTSTANGQAPEASSPTPPVEGSTSTANGQAPEASSLMPPVEGSTSTANGQAPEASSRTPPVKGSTSTANGQAPEASSPTPPVEGSTNTANGQARRPAHADQTSQQLTSSLPSTATHSLTSNPDSSANKDSQPLTPSQSCDEGPKDKIEKSQSHTIEGAAEVAPKTIVSPSDSHRHNSGTLNANPVDFTTSETEESCSEQAKNCDTSAANGVHSENGDISSGAKPEGEGNVIAGVGEGGRKDTGTDMIGSQQLKAPVPLETDATAREEAGDSSSEERKKDGEKDQRNQQEEEDVIPSISFDHEQDLQSFIGPSPTLILQTLTMSNANDFFNLERLETIGDSFLKFAITVYLYCSYPGIHEGKLSYLRSKQVSNYNLYRLGKRRGLPQCMVASKFEPNENWLPPRYVIKGDPAAQSTPKTQVSSSSVTVATAPQKANSPNRKANHISNGVPFPQINLMNLQQMRFNQELEEFSLCDDEEEEEEGGKPEDQEATPETPKCLIPYNLQTQHSLPDKSIADCAEAVIGCYLTACSQRAALLFMSWLGLRVLPRTSTSTDNAMMTTKINNVSDYGYLEPPSSPLLRHVPNVDGILQHYLNGFESFEEKIRYKFRDRSYLLQAFTHASYHYNTVTDCYQRLEFLGDAILDYVITRHLFEDNIKHSPGVLTDLRSALVNNNIFARLAVKWDFHKYFKAVSPQLFQVIEKFVTWQKEKGDDVSLEEEFGDLTDDSNDGGEVEDIEIPKALGDIFESVAGAIYLDSGMSLDAVWHVYYRMMKPQIDQFTARIPKSPVRELLELEPETAKFEKPQRTLDGKIRVTVNVVGKGKFRGIGRNYRIAKSAAAKLALHSMKLMLQEQARLAKLLANMGPIM